MTKRPPVTLLLPNRNNARVLDLVFERLAEHTSYSDYELIAVDDGSTDGSLELLRRWRDSGRLKEFTLIERSHSGVVETLNAGLEVASGELIVQLEGDATIETPGWLERMVDFHQSDPRIGVVTPLVVYENGYIHAAGESVISELGLHDRGSEPFESPGARTVHTQVERRFAPTAGALVTEPAEVDAAIGVFMLYPRAAAEAVGGYDLNFSPVWFDDVDLALSIRREGLKAFYVPGVEVTHRMLLRGDRRPDSAVLRLRSRARKAAGKVVSPELRQRLVRIERRSTGHPPHELRRLGHHYAYWREKWGFDLLNPDLEAVIDRYGHTEVCWAYDPSRRIAGEEIAAAWLAAAAQREGPEVSSA